ncbi:MAG: NADH-quinone oxidoreductase subunit I [Verrucomicrobia bacterium]|nr:MAG: NADH-quinone oxidoreductase subunit I [Verrucomicrobiota bacterium]
MIVSRPQPGLLDRLYIRAILSGLRITLRHFFRRKVTMQYPEQRWAVPEGYRGAPALVRDQDGHTKCVSCQLCEFVCPPRAIRITPPGPDGPRADRPNAEKTPLEFEINMLRCIFCGLCEEVCPEEAIFLRDEYSLTSSRRADLVLGMDKLLEMGGVHHDRHLKWRRKQQEAEAQEEFPVQWPIPAPPAARRSD